jgi:PKD repeat protein
MLRRVFCKLLLVAVVIFSLLALSGTLFAQGRSEEALQHAIAAQEKHTKVLMAIEGVEGTAVGLDDNDQFVVKVYTARPGVAKIPANLEKVPVQVEVTGQFVARLSTTDRWPRPVPIGISTGHPAITAGTIGCRVTDGTNVYALSNNHVYANQNDATIGDEVIQPGAYDGGSLAIDFIGVLSAFEPIDFSGGDNTMDAAIAILTTDHLNAATPSDGYGTPGSAIISPSLGMLVQKYGRTTGWTHGQISGINVRVNVCYESLGGIWCLKQARFVNQITITPGDFSGGGDSGSLIVTDNNNKNPVGLLFAGGDTMTIANPIGPILTRFGVTVDDGSSQTPVAPVADFQGNPTSGDAPLVVNFTDLSTGNPTSWSWNFGDGVGTATAKNPTYEYTSAGTYTVTLTVTNEVDSDTEIKDGYINVTEQPQIPPTADFSASPTSGDAPLTVNFTDLSSENPDSWSWDFGDGGTSPAQNPSYTYNTVGTYSVTLTATNDYGSSVETKEDYINVTASESLVADFEGSPTSGDAPLTVYFTDLSSGNPISWVYDFGDGVSSIWEQNPTHTYNQPGEYTVMLAVSDVGLNVDWEVKSNYITVTGQTGNPPTAEFLATPTSGETPLEVHFTDLSADNPTSWSWDFGDSVGTSTAQDPLYIYDSPGTYTVSLTATNMYGSDTITKIGYITVTEPSTGITLTAIGHKVKGRKTTDLEWSGASNGSIEIYRDGILITTTENDGFYIDATNSRGGGSFTYQVCEIGGSFCSNVVTVYY